MKSNKLEQASAISDKIGKMITRFNTSRLSNISDEPTAMWDEVRRLTGAARSKSYPDTLDASSLNQHYCTISTDNNYTSPLFKLSTKLKPETELVSEYFVFSLLDKLHPTAAGPDGLPFWFLKLAAPFISYPLAAAYVINISLLTSVVPIQWKSSVIHPIPKITNPTEPGHMRPISVVSILARLTERLVNKNFLQSNNLFMF